MYPDDTGLLTSRNSPHNLAEIPFHVYPKSGMDLSITSSNPAIEITSYSYDSSKGTGVIYVKALTEVANGQYITLSAINPDDKVNTPISRTKSINSKYDSYTITPKFDFQAGSFSYYVANSGNGNAGTLYLGDGESYSFYLDVKEPNAKLDDVNVRFNEKTPSPDTTKSISADCTDRDAAHIYLEKDVTDSNGVQYWRIGHNYDYTETGYWTNGDCKKLFDIYEYGSEKCGYTYNPFNWSDHWDHYQTNYIITSDGKKSTSSSDLRELLQSGVKVVDNNFYYYEKKDFTGYPYKYTVTQYDCDHNAKKWNSNKHSSDDRCEANYIYRESINEIFIPTCIGVTECKSDTKEDIEGSSLTISYKDVNNVNTSNNSEKTIKIVVHKRMCPKNIKGLWTKTTDSNGKTCWRFTGVGGGYVIEPFIASKTVSQDANCTKSVSLNTNCMLTSSNTSISVTSKTDSYTVPEEDTYVSNIVETKSSISVTLGADNTLVIKTGPKCNVSYHLSAPNVSQDYNNYYTTKSTITVSYSKNGDGRPCSGTITVIH